MRRGTTPTHTFTIPVDETMIKRIKIIYSQNNETVFEKELEDCSFDNDNVVVTLTQEETFMFDHGVPVKLQMRILTTGGNSLASNIRLVGVEELLDDEVLT